MMRSARLAVQSTGRNQSLYSPYSRHWSRPPIKMFLAARTQVRKDSRRWTGSRGGAGVSGGSVRRTHSQRSFIKQSLKTKLLYHISVKLRPILRLYCPYRVSQSAPKLKYSTQCHRMLSNMTVLSANTRHCNLVNIRWNLVEYLTWTWALIDQLCKGSIVSIWCRFCHNHHNLYCSNCQTAVTVTIANEIQIVKKNSK